MIKNIIFDMGNVLLEWKPAEIVARFIDDSDRIQKITHAVFENELWAKLDRGEASEEEVREYAKKELPEEYHEDIDEVLDNWQYCMPIISETSTLVRYLHMTGFKVYLLSNANIKFVEVKRDLHCLKYMDGYMVSYREKCAKPSPEIYKKFLERFDLNPEECVFIDDLEANCEGAKKCGIDAIQYKGDYTQLVDELNRRGVEIV